MTNQKRDDLNIYSQEDNEVVKPHIQYPNKYELINTEEDLKKHFGKKLKRAWFNERNKFCLESYILYAQDKDDPLLYVFIKVIKGKAQDDRIKKTVDEFLTKECQCFVGYIENNNILKEAINLKLQGDY
jgi:hypothetical protein